MSGREVTLTRTGEVAIPRPDLTHRGQQHETLRSYEAAVRDSQVETLRTGYNAATQTQSRLRQAGEELATFYREALKDGPLTRDAQGQVVVPEAALATALGRRLKGSEVQMMLDERVVPARVQSFLADPQNAASSHLFVDVSKLDGNGPAIWGGTSLHSLAEANDRMAALHDRIDALPESSREGRVVHVGYAWNGAPITRTRPSEEQVLNRQGRMLETRARSLAESVTRQLNGRLDAIERLQTSDDYIGVTVESGESPTTTGSRLLGRQETRVAAQAVLAESRTLDRTSDQMSRHMFQVQREERAEQTHQLYQAAAARAQQQQDAERGRPPSHAHLPEAGRRVLDQHQQAMAAIDARGVESTNRLLAAELQSMVSTLGAQATGASRQPIPPATAVKDLQTLVSGLREYQQTADGTARHEQLRGWLNGVVLDRQASSYSMSGLRAEAMSNPQIGISRADLQRILASAEGHLETVSALERPTVAGRSPTTRAPSQAPTQIAVYQKEGQSWRSADLAADQTTANLYRQLNGHGFGIVQHADGSLQMYQANNQTFIGGTFSQSNLKSVLRETVTRFNSRA